MVGEVATWAVLLSFVCRNPPGSLYVASTSSTYISIDAHIALPVEVLPIEALLRLLRAKRLLHEVDKMQRSLSMGSHPVKTVPDVAVCAVIALFRGFDARNVVSRLRSFPLPLGQSEKMKNGESRGSPQH